MSGRGMKLHNEYAAQFGELFADTPKAVFAAIAFSFAMRLNEDSPNKAVEEVIREWNSLHENGIVPQQVPKGWAA